MFRYWGCRLAWSRLRGLGLLRQTTYDSKRPWDPGRFVLQIWGIQIRASPFQNIYKQFGISRTQLLKMSKKKVGSSGRFGARYGKSIRQKISDIEKKEKSRYECPKCHKVSVKRISSGIWQCRSCNTKMGGKAYIPWE